MQPPTRLLLSRLRILVRGREQGQTMAEYAVVLGVITIALIGAFSFVGGSVSTALSQIATRI
jgi:Flp pilus assembly pilin Flp